MASTVGTIPKPVRMKDGVLKVSDTRVTLDTVVYHFNQGTDVAEIQREYDSMSLAQVHSAIAYYLHNKVEVDRYLTQRAQDRESLWQAHEAKYPRQITREILLARKNGSARNRK